MNIVINKDDVNYIHLENVSIIVALCVLTLYTVF